MKAEKIISPNQYGYLQLLANVLFILIWFFSNEGLSFWDDFTYLNFANEINQGLFEIGTNHFTSRVGLIYPTAWVIDVLGINEYSMVVFPLVCGLGLINLFYFLGRSINYWIGLIGGLMIICDYHMINFSIHLFPELPLTLCIFIFLIGYYLVLKGDVDYRLTAFVCALALFGAFLIKTTVFLLIPLIVFLFINDRIQKRNRGFWLIFITLSLLFFTLHGLWYSVEKGSFMYRFQNIADNHVATIKTFFDKENLLWKRLTYLPLLTFTKGGYFIPLFMALPSIFLLKRKDFSLKEADHFWPLASMILILSYWFFSTNWRYYSPLPLETRHIAFFIPVFIMSAATFWPKHKWFVLAEKRWFVALVLLTFFAIPAYTISKSKNKGFDQEKEIIEEYFVFNKISQTVITDGLTSYGYPYFYDFTEVGDKYLWFSEMDLDEVRQGDFVLENRAYFNQEYNDDQNFGVLMSWISEKGWKFHLLEEKKGVRLYRIE